jgi:hypothetical protein
LPEQWATRGSRWAPVDDASGGVAAWIVAASRVAAPGAHKYPLVGSRSSSRSASAWGCDCSHSRKGALARWRSAVLVAGETSSAHVSPGAAAQLHGTEQPAPRAALETTSSTRVTRIDRPMTTGSSKTAGRRGARHGVYRYPLLLPRRLRVLVEEASEVLEVCRPVATLTVDRVACARDARDFDVWVRSRETLLPT